MSDTAYKDPFEDPREEREDEDPDPAKSFGMHEEFISKVGEAMDVPGFDVDGYVGSDGKPQPHQTPQEVAAEEDAFEEAADGARVEVLERRQTAKSQQPTPPNKS